MAPVRTSNGQRPVTVAHIITAAESWLGTPYHHQQSVKGIGCDCLGLIRGIYEEVLNRKTAPITPYSRDWADVTGNETLIKAAKAHLVEKQAADPVPGDVLIFRFRPWMVAKHAGLMAENNTMIHAIEGAPVTKVHLTPWWTRRIAAIFQFPNLTI